MSRGQPPFPIVLLLAVCGFANSVRAAEPAESIEFFENRIRPVLVQHCYQCHSSEADEIGGSLVLDSPGGMMTGGDSGPAIDPGNVEGSLLISAIRYESSEMPPDGKLPKKVIHDFERWIAAGAADPRQASVDPLPVRGEIDLDAGRKFWAFQPLAFARTPSITSPGSQGTIDQFLDDRLQQTRINANERAEPSVRLRRLAFDLTGLPPDSELQDRWLADPSQQNWQRIVDSMLASPEFAEHWARHWMDVARYADSNGSDFNATHHEAWRYRDYLIRSFADDRPVDQMIRQQIAGDLLPAKTDAQRYDNTVASTFLMLGTKMLSERDKAKLTLDVVDEQIDTVGRAFLGLTLGCARCHDHKFDPVPTEDYYALAGIFKSSITLKGESQKYVSTWNRVPLPTSDEHHERLKKHTASVKSLEADIKKAEQSLKSAKENAAAKYKGIVVDDRDAEKVGQWKASVLMKDFVGEGYIHDNNTNKGETSIRFTTRLPKTGRYEVRLSHSPGSSRAAAIPITIVSATGEEAVLADQRTVEIAPMWTSLGTFDFSSEIDAVVTISNEGTSGYVIADAVQFLAQEAKDDSNSDKGKADESATQLQLVQSTEQELKALKDQLVELKSSAPDPLPEAMAPSDRPTDEIADSPVHIRGEVKNFGTVVPRGFLRVCSGGNASIRDPRGSGRIELADWLTDPDNPLVARVFVNRVWMHLMGQGLVRTVDNFGMQGERPTHPELLDTLAAEFVRGGWYTKSLIRKIVMTEAYVRSSDYNAASIAIDPENRLLWRAHRRRLPAESIRDTMLFASGQLDLRSRAQPMRGRGTLVSSNNGDSKANFDDVSQECRSIYLPVVRGYMPAMLTALDVADADMLVGRRPTTNVPSQALVLINSPEVNRWARLTAARILEPPSDFAGRLNLAYELCLQRSPSSTDRAIAAQFFGDRTESLDVWHEFVAAVFAGTEFRLLD